MDLLQLTETVCEVSPDDAASKVLNLMARGQMRLAAVIGDRKLLGIIAEPEVTRHRAISESGRSTLRARDMMSTVVEKMPVGTPVIDAARAMRSRRIQYLALVDDGDDFVGVVTLRRILFEVMDDLGLKVDNLERELMADGPGG